MPLLFLYNVPIRQDVMVTGPGIQAMITVWNDRREGHGIYIGGGRPKYLIQSFHGFAAPYFVSFMNGESSFSRTRRTHSSQSAPSLLTARQAQMSDTVPLLPAAAQFWRNRSMDS